MNIKKYHKSDLAYLMNSCIGDCFVHRSQHMHFLSKQCSWGSTHIYIYIFFFFYVPCPDAYLTLPWEKLLNFIYSFAPLSHVLWNHYFVTWDDQNHELKSHLFSLSINLLALIFCMFQTPAYNIILIFFFIWLQ